MPSGKPEPTGPVVAAGTSQVSTDVQSWWHPIYEPRSRYQRYDLFHKAYNELAVVQTGIEALVLLSNGPLVGDGEDPEADAFALDLLRSVNFTDVLDRAYRQYYVFGNDATETVWSSDFRQIVKFAVIDSRTLFLRKSKQGEITEFHQIPSLTLPTFGGPFAVTIPPERIMYNKRAELGNNVYGVSVLQAPHQSGLFRTLQIIEQSKGEIYHKLAASPQHYNYNPRPNDRIKKPEAQGIVTDLKRDIGTRKMTDDVFTVGPITNEPLFKFDGNTNLSQDQQFVLEILTSAMGIVGEVFGFSWGQAQSQTREKIAVMIDRIDRVRKQRSYQINTKIMPQIAATYNLSTLPQVKFTASRVVDGKVEAERLAAAIVPVQQLLRMGLIDGSQAVEMLELPGVVSDPEKLDEWLNTAATAPDPPDQTKDQLPQEEEINR